MVAVPSLSSAGTPPPSDPGEQRILIHGLSWKDYVLMSDILGDDHPGLHLTYLEGTLEIMSPSRTHEGQKKVIARLIELHALVRGIRILGFGSTTYRREEKKRGLEPDECYCVGSDKEYPDIALEVIHTSWGIDKLRVYEGLGVREVWLFKEGRFQIFELALAGGYAERAGSGFFPDLDLARLAAHVAMPDQDEAVRTYWDYLRGGA